MSTDIPHVSLHDIVESAPVGMIMVDAAGVIHLANGEAHEIFGYGRGQLIGLSVETLVPADRRQEHAALRARFRDTPEPRRMGYGRELVTRRADGTEIAVEIGLSPIRNDPRGCVLATIVDVTRRRAQDQQLQQSSEARELSNLELQQFAFVASHDLQTPLRAISGFAHFLQQDYQGHLSPKADVYLSRIVDNVQRMQKLVDDLLELCRVESRSRAFESVALQEAFDNALVMLESSVADNHGNVSAEPLPIVRGDLPQLSQLFQNLIGNAIKYCGHAPPRVRVSAVRDQGHWIVTVADNGIGIAPKHHSKIFEIFQRLHPHEAYPGTGIGLAICRRIVQRHGGKLWLDSQPGQGSRFHFSLPASSKESNS